MCQKFAKPALTELRSWRLTAKKHSGDRQRNSKVIDYWFNCGAALERYQNYSTRSIDNNPF